jgi:hypothetical protein
MRGLLFFSIVAYIGVAPAWSQVEKSTSGKLPGDGVADPAGNVGYFPNTTGGIDALELATGKLLWASKDADRPLVATNDRLLAQAGKTNQVRLIVIDKEGKRVLESDPIKFPDWVSVQTAYGRSFQSGARLDGKSALLSWQARAFYAGGARPTPQIEKAARKDASGVSRINLETGKVEALSAEQIAAGKFLPVPVEARNPTFGKLTLSVKDSPAKNPKNFFEKRRTLQAVNEAKAVVWERDIAAPIFLPPLP